MTNYDKYKNEIKRLGHYFIVRTDGSVGNCEEEPCSNCLFRSTTGSCFAAAIEWAMKEADKE